jgi:quinol monooxygenase YgiN
MPLRHTRHAATITLPSASLPLQWAGEEKTGPRTASDVSAVPAARGEPFPKKNGADTVGKAFTLQVTMFIKPELRDEYLAALREFLVLARQEPGCIFLYASEAVDERGKIVVFERFRDPDEFNEILQRDYAQRYLKLSESAYAAPRVIVRLDPIEPLDQ